MKKGIRFTSIFLAFALIVSVIGGTTAFAAETAPAQITFTDGFEKLDSVPLYSTPVFLATLSDPELTLTAESSDESVLAIVLLPDEENPGTYGFALLAAQNGEATITFTVSDGTTFERTITVEGDGEPNYTISSDTTNDFSIVKGKSYLMKIHFETSGTGILDIPGLMSDDESVIKITLEKKDEAKHDYYYRLEAVGEVGENTNLYYGSLAYLPEQLCNVTVAAASVAKSDTNNDFSVRQGASYTFKLSNAASFTAGTNGVFKVDLVKKSGNDSYYKITATGKPGQATGFYMAAANQASQKVCVVTVAAVPAPVAKSDTNSNFSVKQGASYTFKLSNAASFTAGTNGVFKVELVKKSGNDSYYKITATGQPGQATGFYMSAGQSNQKVCVVTVAATPQISIQSDTNRDFAIAKASSYQFKITAPGAASVNLFAGTSGVFNITLVRHTGDDFFYKITAVGQPGAAAGIYASVPNQPGKKLCVVAIAQG